MNVFIALFCNHVGEDFFFLKQKCSNHHVISEAMVLIKTPAIMSFMVKWWELAKIREKSVYWT